MSDSVVAPIITTAADAVKDNIWLLVACALVVAVLCYGLGWLFYQLDRRFPARTQNTSNKE